MNQYRVARYSQAQIERIASHRSLVEFSFLCKSQGFLLRFADMEKNDGGKIQSRINLIDRLFSRARAINAISSFTFLNLIT